MNIKLNEIKDPKLRDKIIAADEFQNRRLSSCAILEPSDQNVSMAQDTREDPYTVRHPALVTFTCFRMRSLDDENTCTKFFTDSLRYAGALFDDSKEWAKIVVREELVSRPELERTEIIVEYGPSKT